MRNWFSSSPKMLFKVAIHQRQYNNKAIDLFKCGENIMYL
jgi:hypothetical protein